MLKLAGSNICLNHLFQIYWSTSGSKACWVNILVERQGVTGNRKEAREGNVDWGGGVEGGKWEGWGVGSEGKPIRATEECGWGVSRTMLA